MQAGQTLHYRQPDEQCARNGYDTAGDEITAAVTACKTKEVRHLLERFTAKMLKKNIRGYERQFYIQRLVAAMLVVAERRAFGQSGAGRPVQPVGDDQQHRHRRPDAEFLMDEVAVPAADLLTEFRQYSSSELVKKCWR